MSEFPIYFDDISDELQVGIWTIFVKSWKKYKLSYYCCVLFKVQVF